MSMKAVDWQGSIQKVLQTARTLKIRQDAQRGEILLVAGVQQENRRRRLKRVKETESPDESRVRPAGEDQRRGGSGRHQGESEEDSQDPDKGRRLDRRA